MRPLTAIARDVFPALLGDFEGRNAMTLGGGVFGGTSFGDVTNLTAAVMRHPLFEAVGEAAKASSWLGEYLTFDGHEGPVWQTPSGGIHMPAETLSATLLHAAASELLGRNLSLTNDAYVALVSENLDAIRRMLAGETIQSYVLVGFSGLELLEGALLETPWGVAQPANRHARQVQPFGEAANSVLCQPFDLSQSFDEHDHSRAEARRADVQDFYERVQLLVPFSVLMAARAKSVYGAPIIAWRTEVAPFDPGTSISAPLKSNAMTPGVELEQSNVEDLAAWAKTVEATFNDHLQIAVGRLVSAVSDRRETVDKLVDAVVTWEALFGVDVETTFRVTAAIARILKTGAEERTEVQKELKRVYAARSKAVHGQSPGDDTGLAQVAVDSAVKVFRRLLEDFPELLRLSSSVERSNRVLLGDPGEWGDPPANV